jgi:hypothetical protein
VAESGECRVETSRETSEEEVMIPRELPDKKTPLTVIGLAEALLAAWDVTGTTPTRAQLELKVAHVHLETGLKACHNWELGNKKSPVGGNGVRCWQFFPCGEELDVKTAEDAASKSPELILLGKRYTRNGKAMVTVTVKPKHPWCCFRAFESIEDAAKDQMLFTQHRDAAWQGLLTGDPLEYSKGLHAVKYFTADPAMYSRILVQRLEIVRSALKSWHGGE